MIGNNIKRLRIENGMTQKALADKLFVSAQAVSRWENNDVEPSLSTITELSKIFGVSTDEILGLTSTAEAAPPSEPERIVETEYVYREPPKQILALCSKCNSPIYDKNDIFRDWEDKISCRSCKEKEEENEKRQQIKKSKTRRILSFVLGIPAMIVAIIGGIYFIPEYWGFWIYFGISIFAFITYMILMETPCYPMKRTDRSIFQCLGIILLTSVSVWEQESAFTNIMV